MTVSRRALLLGGSGLALAGCGVPGTGAAGDRSVNGSFTSTAMKGARLGWRISYPRGHQTSDRLPVVLSLHGRGNNHGTSFSDLHLDGARAKAVDAGATPFVIAAVDGGDHSYWHRRKDGTDAGKMLRDEFLPLLDKRGLDTGRLGLFGWSMGGYGALLLVGRNVLTPLGVAVSSPALFTSAGATAAGAFDDPADFDRNDVYAHPRWLANTPLRVDCGRQDPFYAATRDYVARMRPHPAGGFVDGGHDARYWSAVAPAQLEFLGSLLT